MANVFTLNGILVVSKSANQGDVISKIRAIEGVTTTQSSIFQKYNNDETGEVGLSSNISIKIDPSIITDRGGDFGVENIDSIIEEISTLPKVIAFHANEDELNIIKFKFFQEGVDRNGWSLNPDGTTWVNEDNKIIGSLLKELNFGDYLGDVDPMSNLPGGTELDYDLLERFLIEPGDFGLRNYQGIWDNKLNKWIVYPSEKIVDIVKDNNSDNIFFIKCKENDNNNIIIIRVEIDKKGEPSFRRASKKDFQDEPEAIALTSSIKIKEDPSTERKGLYLGDNLIYTSKYRNLSKLGGKSVVYLDDNYDGTYIFLVPEGNTSVKEREFTDMIRRPLSVSIKSDDYVIQKRNEPPKIYNPIKGGEPRLMTKEELNKYEGVYDFSGNITENIEQPTSDGYSLEVDEESRKKGEQYRQSKDSEGVKTKVTSYVKNLLTDKGRISKHDFDEIHNTYSSDYIDAIRKGIVKGIKEYFKDRGEAGYSVEYNTIKNALENNEKSLEDIKLKMETHVPEDEAHKKVFDDVKRYASKLLNKYGELLWGDKNIIRQQYGSFSFIDDNVIDFSKDIDEAIKEAEYEYFKDKKISWEPENKNIKNTNDFRENIKKEFDVVLTAIEEDILDNSYKKHEDDIGYYITKDDVEKIIKKYNVIDCETEVPEVYVSYDNEGNRYTEEKYVKKITNSRIFVNRIIRKLGINVEEQISDKGSNNLQENKTSNMNNQFSMTQFLNEGVKSEASKFRAEQAKIQDEASRKLGELSKKVKPKHDAHKKDKIKYLKDEVCELFKDFKAELGALKKEFLTPELKSHITQIKDILSIAEEDIETHIKELEGKKNVEGKDKEDATNEGRNPGKNRPHIPNYELTKKGGEEWKNWVLDDDEETTNEGHKPGKNRPHIPNYELTKKGGEEWKNWILNDDEEEYNNGI